MSSWKGLDVSVIGSGQASGKISARFQWPRIIYGISHSYIEVLDSTSAIGPNESGGLLDRAPGITSGKVVCSIHLIISWHMSKDTKN